MLCFLPIQNDQSLHTPVRWVFPVFLDLINVTSVVTSPSPRTFFTGELHIRLFATVWVTSEVVHCLQITLGWNKLIVFRSIKNGHGDILKLLVMTPVALLLQSVLRIQALRPLNIHINKSGLTAPNKTTVYGDGTDLETSPYQFCDKEHCKIGYGAFNLTEYSHWSLFVCLHFTGWELWCCRPDVSQCQEHVGISIKGQHEWRQGAHPWVLLLARVPNQCKSLWTWWVLEVCLAPFQKERSRSYVESWSLDYVGESF